MTDQLVSQWRIPTWADKRQKTVWQGWMNAEDMDNEGYT